MYTQIHMHSSLWNWSVGLLGAFKSKDSLKLPQSTKTTAAACYGRLAVMTTFKVLVRTVYALLSFLSVKHLSVLENPCWIEGKRNKNFNKKV